METAAVSASPAPATAHGPFRRRATALLRPALPRDFTAPRPPRPERRCERCSRLGSTGSIILDPQDRSAGEANVGDQAKSAGEAKATADPQERSAGEANVGDHAKSAGEAPRYWPEVHVHGEDGTPRDKAPCMYPGIYNVMLSLGHIQLPVSADGECRKRGITRTCRARGGLQLSLCLLSGCRRPTANRDGTGHRDVGRRTRLGNAISHERPGV